MSRNKSRSEKKEEQEMQVSTGRKVPQAYENPLDNILYDFAIHVVNPYVFRKAGFTANGITLLSFAFGVLAAWLVWTRQYVAAALAYAVSYFLDCADGSFARAYNQVTALGDFLDHGSDVLKHGLLLSAVLLTPYLTGTWKTVFTVCFGVGFALTFVHMGCQENVYNQSHLSPSLMPLRMLCSQDKAPHIIQWTRYVGMGTTALLLFVVLLLAPWFGSVA
jgi:phosphatidylglycerophosphate synthase